MTRRLDVSLLRLSRLFLPDGLVKPNRSGYTPARVRALAPDRASQTQVAGDRELLELAVGP